MILRFPPRNAGASLKHHPASTPGAVLKRRGVEGLTNGSEGLAYRPMGETSATSLGAAFGALTGHRPFRWQSRLFDLLLVGQPPAAVDVPTGLGKTSVMALWLIALARGADLPRRLIYVVDRRAVVDQATRFAADLCDNLPSELTTALAVDDAGLAVSTLRGGKADNRAWLDDPSKPAIVVGTVDMVGSRLLFEGYGVSRGMRPYQAGFVGADTLIVLDEAHLCPPFEALLRDVEERRDSTFGPVGRHADPCAVTPPVRVMSLSATGRPALDTSRTTFGLDSADREEDVVRQRLTATKRLGLCLLDDPKDLRGKMVERAIELGFGAVPRRVVVYCDQRRDAVEVKKLIDRQIRTKMKESPDVPLAESELLVGARRVRERERVEAWLDKVGLLGSAEAPPDAPTFLVATSAGEVGIDMDADHMVCDLVAFERMVQRLGRVNRRGRRSALVEVIYVRPQVRPDAKGKAKADQERALVEHEARVRVLRALEKDAEGRYDASPEALVELKTRLPDLVDGATTPPPLHPPLTRPHLEAWAMTSLIEHEGRTEVEPWLRGWEKEDEPQVEVVWRAHLPHLRVGDDVTVPPSMVAEFFQAAPIHATEKLETSRSHVTDWLFKRIRALKQAADGLDSNDIVAVVINRSGVLVASRLFGELVALGEQPKRNREKQAWERQLAGATLVVDARFGGLDDDGMLCEKRGAPAVADADDDWLASGDADGTPPIEFRVVRAETDGQEESNDTDGEWLLNRTFEIEQNDAGGGERLEVYKWAVEPTDEDSRSIQARPQGLREHAEQVAAKARQIAARLHLPTAEVDGLERAARLHDDGKAALRWQEAMNAPRCGRPYAKTKGGGNWRRLEGYRHEFGSLLKAEKLLKAESPDTQDLILHLIAAHHGYARPVIPTAGCDEAPPTLLAASAREAALRYARLQRRYGVWGLAWREAILRAADQSASRESAGAKRGDNG